MDEMIFYPSRIHDKDMPRKVIVIDHSYQHLNLPYEPIEATFAWFHETWANRLQANGEPVIVVSRIHEGGEGKNE